MDTIVFELTLSDGRTLHLLAWFSDNEPKAENCDACVGYSILDPNTRQILDGGEMDFASDIKNYQDINDVRTDLVNFIRDDLTARVLAAVPTDVDPEIYM